MNLFMGIGPNPQSPIPNNKKNQSFKIKIKKDLNNLIFVYFLNLVKPLINNITLYKLIIFI